MAESYEEKINGINCFCNEIDAQYHRASLKMGITDSVSVVLYMLRDRGGECTLGEICKNFGISKQTVNSAVRGLEADGSVRLVPVDGKSKKIVLTGKGEEVAAKTVDRLLLAERAAFETWEKSEIDEYVRLTRKHLACLKREIDKL